MLLATSGHIPLGPAEVVKANTLQEGRSLLSSNPNSSEGCAVQESPAPHILCWFSVQHKGQMRQNAKAIRLPFFSTSTDAVWAWCPGHR